MNIMPAYLLVYWNENDDRMNIRYNAESLDWVFRKRVKINTNLVSE